MIYRCSLFKVYCFLLLPAFSSEMHHALLSKNQHFVHFVWSHSLLRLEEGKSAHHWISIPSKITDHRCWEWSDHSDWDTDMHYINIHVWESPPHSLSLVKNCFTFAWTQFSGPALNVCLEKLLTFARFYWNTIFLYIIKCTQWTLMSHIDSKLFRGKTFFSVRMFL